LSVAVSAASFAAGSLGRNHHLLRQQQWPKRTHFVQIALERQMPRYFLQVQRALIGEFSAGKQFGREANVRYSGVGVG